MRILMLSATPLVGAPIRLSNAFIENGWDVDLYTQKDYPNHLRGIFPIGELDHSLMQHFSNEKLYDFVWIHNYVDPDIIKSIRTKYKCPMVLHVHSGVHEGPLFNKLIASEYLNLFTVRCVVSQAWARLYQNFTMIPNVVPEIYGCQDLDLNLKQVMFTPSHGKGGRFGFKGADKTERIINKFYKSFSRNTTKEGVNIIINKQPIRQSSLHVLRSHTHVSIDEIVTGGFHQVSLEALATGGCVINGADIFSLMNFAHSVEAEELPPFITVKDEAEFRRALFQITHDHDFLLDAILQSRKYYKNFLTTRRLGGLIQKKVLDLL